jgi:hypothetical protein
MEKVQNINLYKKMFKVMEESEAVEKNMQVGTGNNSYRAVSEAAILNLVKPLFKKYKLVIFPIDCEISESTMVWDKYDQYKKVSLPNLRAVTVLKAKYKIVDTETGEFEILCGVGNGADPQDKGAGKSSTYSYKNVLSKTFMLFSGDDAENVHSDDIYNEPEEKPATPAPQKNKPNKAAGKAPIPYPTKIAPDPSPSDLITHVQALQMFYDAKNDDLVKEIMAKYKYTKSKDITNSDYEKICIEIHERLE